MRVRRNEMINIQYFYAYNMIIKLLYYINC